MTPAGLAVAALGGAVATGFGVEAVRRFALRRQILDVPNERSSHVAPTPRGGGVAIVAACAAGWAVDAASGAGGALAALAVSALLVAVVSAVDDVRTLTARSRFTAHVVAAAVLIVGAGGWDVVEVPFVGAVPLGWGGAALAGVWVVGLTNAFNFMDGIDGIAGAQGAVAGTAWAVVGAGLGQAAVGLTGALVAGAALGFLVHNWPPARIFMGDVGSAFLGFTLAAVALVADGARIPVAAVLFVWPFVFDASYTFVRRLRRGENVFEAHRSHVYQRLVIAGWTHRGVSLVYAGLAALSASSGAAWALGGPAVAVALGLALPLALLPLVRRVERRRGA